MDVVVQLKTKLLLHWTNHGTLNVSNVQVVDLLSQVEVVVDLL